MRPVRAVWVVMITVSRLTEPTDDASRELGRLLPQLTDEAWPLTTGRLSQILEAPTHVFVARDNKRGDTQGGQIVGVAMIAIVYQLKDTKAWLEDAVVDDAYRGQGIAQKLVAACIEAAREAGVRSVNLTSAAHRGSAHRVYEKLGFVRRDTNVFRLPLSD